MAIVSEVLNDTIILKDSGDVVLKIKETISKDPQTVIIELDGDLRMDARFFVGDEMNTLILLEKNIIVDMKKVTNLSPACSEILLNTQRTIDENGIGTMCLRNIPSKIWKYMKETGLSELLAVTEG